MSGAVPRAPFGPLPPCSTILPVALLGWLSFVILVLDRRDLSARLGVTVTLFLALAAVCRCTEGRPARLRCCRRRRCRCCCRAAAVTLPNLAFPPSAPQFVVTADQPASSYILPTQQQIVTVRRACLRAHTRWPPILPSGCCLPTSLRHPPAVLAGHLQTHCLLLFVRLPLPRTTRSAEPSLPAPLPARLPLQTYCLLLCMAVEATAVHSIETYKERQKTGKRQREARQRYLARMAAIKRLEQVPPACLLGSREGTAPSAKHVPLPVITVMGCRSPVGSTTLHAPPARRHPPPLSPPSSIEQEEADAAARHAATGLPSHQPPELARASAGVAGSAGSTTAAAARRADSLPAAASGSLDALLAPGELVRQHSVAGEPEQRGAQKARRCRVPEGPASRRCSPPACPPFPPRLHACRSSCAMAPSHAALRWAACGR